MSIEYIVYPNPFNAEIEITLTGDLNNQATLSLFDVEGRLVSNHVYAPSSSNFHEAITTESLQAGLYILKVKSGTLQKSIRLIKM